MNATHTNAPVPPLNPASNSEPQITPAAVYATIEPAVAGANQRWIHVRRDTPAAASTDIAASILTPVEFYDALRKRRMVRSFTDQPVDPAVVERILDAARRGPSAGYSQGVEFVVVTDPRMRDTIARPGDAIFKTSGHKNFVRQAPVHIVICCSAEIYRSRYRESDKMRVRSRLTDDELWRVPYWYVDAGAAMMLILLAAINEGIAAAFIGVLPQGFRDLLGIPPAYEPVGIALLGHEAPDARQYGDVSATKRPRRPLTDVVHRERW